MASNLPHKKRRTTSDNHTAVELKAKPADEPSAQHQQNHNTAELSAIPLRRSTRTRKLKVAGELSSKVEDTNDMDMPPSNINNNKIETDKQVPSTFTKETNNKRSSRTSSNAHENREFSQNNEKPTRKSSNASAESLKQTTTEASVRKSSNASSDTTTKTRKLSFASDSKQEQQQQNNEESSKCEQQQQQVRKDSNASETSSSNKRKASFASDTKLPPDTSAAATTTTLTLSRGSNAAEILRKRKESIGSSRGPVKKRKDSDDRNVARKPSESSTEAARLRNNSESTMGTLTGLLPGSRKNSNDMSLPVDDLAALPSLPEEAIPKAASAASALEHLEALKTTGTNKKDDSSQETFASSGHRIIMEAILFNEAKSNSTTNAEGRFDSSIQRDRADFLTRERLDSFIGRRSRLESWGGMSDLSAAGQLLGDMDGDQKPSAIPSGIMVRDRLNSLASLGDMSVGQFGEDIQAYVAAAMETVGDQLHDLAGIVESVAAAALQMDKLDSESVQSPLIGALQDFRSRSHSTSSAGIPVDVDAVQAAVDAGEAASGSLGISEGKMPAPKSSLTSRYARRHLPKANRDRSGSNLSNDVGKNMPNKPLKKRRKNPPPTLASMPTPRIANRAATTVPDEAKSSGVKPKRAPTTVKWDSMLSCLYDYINEKKAEETRNMTEEERNEWVWDGNVPTSYKTKDGKALGRWVNNQRTAKAKGSLKPDRGERLTETGLKWSVVSSNCWNEMLQELRVYVEEQSKNGCTWDGNVPTSYQIKTRSQGEFNGEDKNLGRWVNRQRSLYQSGKLRKDRQKSLEKLGLKWSMLSLTSWEDMFESLKAYVERSKKAVGKWDGNVPATFRTEDNPSRNLGRWVNRQRTAYLKNKLRKEYSDRLDELGLKWTINQRPDGVKSENDLPENDNVSVERAIMVEETIAI